MVMCRTARRRVQFKIIIVVKFELIKMLLKDIKLICNNYITAEEAGAIMWSAAQTQGSSGSSDSVRPK